MGAPCAPRHTHRQQPRFRLDHRRSSIPRGVRFAAMEASNREASGQGAEGGAGTAALEPTDEPRVDRAEQEAEHSKLPHLWASRPWPLRIVFATVPSAAYG